MACDPCIYFTQKNQGRLLKMEQYVIKGGVHLEGEVVIAGAKNAALFQIQLHF